MMGPKVGGASLVWRAVTDPAELWRLKPDWDALWRAADGAHVQTERACFHAWHNDKDPSPRRLCALTGWQDGRLVFLWPLVIRRRHGLWNLASQLGPQAAELTAVLTEPGPEREARTQGAWDFLRRTGQADIVWLDYITLGSPLHHVMTETADRRGQAGTNPDVAPYLRWDEGTGWAEYYASLSAYTRKMQNKKHRGLAKTGEVTFEAASDPQRRSALAGWLLEQKRHWARKTGKDGPWLTAPEYDCFLRELAGDPGATDCVVYTLSVNGAVIAALLASVGTRHVDWIIAAFDPAWGQYSPGLLLNEYCLRWAMERGLAVEFGRGLENNKKFWSRGVCHDVLCYRVPVSRRGVLVEAARHRWAQARALGGLVFGDVPVEAGEVPAAEAPVGSEPKPA